MEVLLIIAAVVVLLALDTTATDPWADQPTIVVVPAQPRSTGTGCMPFLVALLGIVALVLMGR
jgi:hypothetical protein